MTSRRQVIKAAVLSALGCSLPGYAHAALEVPAGQVRLTTGPRQRIIIDNDFSGDPDGLFQLAHHLASPSVDIRLVIGSHIHIKDGLDASAVQAANAVALADQLMDCMEIARRPVLVAGREQALEGTRSETSPAAAAIIAEAMRQDTDLPLFYVAGAGLTDLAVAYRLEPRIGKRLTLIWIGGREHPELVRDLPARPDAEYNSTIDLLALKAIFNDSDIQVWQVPRDAYRQMLVSHAELEARLAPAGRLGALLLSQINRIDALARKARAPFNLGLGETYILGDSPLVTLTALQSSFEADSASSAYVVRSTPRITGDGTYEARADGRPMRIYQRIDLRLTLEDMFIKFAKYGRDRAGQAAIGSG